MTILVVDDSKLIRQIVRNNIESLNIHSRDIHEAVDGAEAVKKLNSIKQIDLIITDLQMPNMDGIEFVKRIRTNKNFQSTRIIAISSQLTPSIKVLLERMGVLDFIEKPFDLDKFMALIKPIISEIKGEDKTINIVDMRSEMTSAYHRQIPLFSMSDDSIHIIFPDFKFHIATDTFLKFATFERVEKRECVTEE